ncbi:unnamed protein product [Darwinula stevensoni]|uniref:Uncharacterized protein n=1 Tax=Darwinula stevensoni TaxID=69355 RepID=A0A7R9FQP1_9CRUS|nr:unnamed protein product [Darwinula stevensoni]CAG0899882.1 unnamed protein product [Darwinula stevensoni]
MEDIPPKRSQGNNRTPPPHLQGCPTILAMDEIQKAVRRQKTETKHNLGSPLARNEDRVRKKQPERTKEELHIRPLASGGKLIQLAPTSTSVTPRSPAIKSRTGVKKSKAPLPPRQMEPTSRSRT